MERGKAIKFMRDLLVMMVEKKGSDLFIAVGAPPAIKLSGKMTPIGKGALKSEDTESLTYSIMNDRQLKEYEATKECNFAISPTGIGRFRVNAFIQQGFCGLVVRIIEVKVPTIEKLGMPSILKDVVLYSNGIVIVAGGSGSGKSSTLAAMIEHRNVKTFGHIITLEDPIEFVHPHKGCIITQREIGVDTEAWGIALKNVLRQAPDVILLGEIRDSDTMDYAINFAETGHLAVATVHANNANQAMDRIINFFPSDRKDQLLMDLSLNLKAVISQRLIIHVDKKRRVPAVEILLNTPIVSSLILKGDVHEIKEIMKKSNELGMKTFDQSLFDLYEEDKITYENAISKADSANELRLKIKLEGKESKKHDFEDQIGNLSLEDNDLR